MKINQIIKENFNGEYDDEAGMAQTNLHTIARAAQGLLTKPSVKLVDVGTADAFT